MERFDNRVPKLSYYALAQITQFCLDRTWGFARPYEPCMHGRADRHTCCHAAQPQNVLRSCANVQLRRGNGSLSETTKQARGTPFMAIVPPHGCPLVDTSFIHETFALDSESLVLEAFHLRCIPFLLL